jgi:hypothetical protein
VLVSVALARHNLYASRPLKSRPYNFYTKSCFILL